MKIMNKEEMKRLNNIIDSLQQENDLLKNKISKLEDLNLDLQFRTKFAEDGMRINERTIDMQRQAIEHYEKMFNYLTGGDSNE